MPYSDRRVASTQGFLCCLQCIHFHIPTSFLLTWKSSFPSLLDSGHLETSDSNTGEKAGFLAARLECTRSALLSKTNDLYPSFDLFNFYKLPFFTGKLRQWNIPLFLKLFKPLPLLDKIKCYLKLLSEIAVITFNLWKRKQRSRIGIWMKCSNEVQGFL